MKTTKGSFNEYEIYNEETENNCRKDCFRCRRCEFGYYSLAIMGVS